VQGEANEKKEGSGKETWNTRAFKTEWYSENMKEIK
jgi:hypothetical protein